MYRVFRAKEIIDETIDTQVSMFSNFFPSLQMTREMVWTMSFQLSYKNFYVTRRHTLDLKFIGNSIILKTFRL